MTRAEEFITAVFNALEQEPRVRLQTHPVKVEFENGIVTLSGEVPEIAAKKIALELAASVPSVSGIVDRLRVEPAERMQDGAIRDHVSNALLGEPAFNSYSIRVLVKGEMEWIRALQGEASGGDRIFEVEVSDGVVILNGKVESISHKRLAGVLAWWVPGSRDVVNGMEVFPAMEDSDDELADAVRLVLEKDPLINASQIRVTCRDLEVTLRGAVSTERSRIAAESDAWFIFGVNGVVNDIVVTGEMA